MAEFVHLHCHSEYSLLDGYARIEPMLYAVSQDGGRAVALTDHGVMYGAVDFYLAARERGIKPLIGVEAYVAPHGRTERRHGVDTSPFHLGLIAANATGYRNLIKLTTLAHTEGFYYRPRVDRELLARHHEGLICLSGCMAAEVPRLIRAGDMAAARATAAWYRDVFGSDGYFLEIQEHDLAEQTATNAGVIEISRDLGIPLVATNDVHYVRPEDMRGQDLLLCIQTNAMVGDVQRMRMETNTFYLRTAAEMARLFPDHPDALANTLRVAERVDLTIDFNRLHLPDVPVPDGFTVDAHLARLCQAGLRERMGDSPPPAYRERLAYELGVVRQTGFAQYILIVWDIVDFARRRGIVAGPRGSAAGALVLFALGVSDVDPVKHRLTFERFLNPERREMPDVDLDFADDRRDEIIEYLVQRYGRDHVAQIVTFGTLGAKAAIRDTGRVLGIPLDIVEGVAKQVPALPLGQKIETAVRDNAQLARMQEEDERVRSLLADAQLVEGYVRHSSTHAAGVVIAREPLTEYTPLQAASRSGDGLMTQYHADNLARIGLLKMDILGLSNLTILGRAVELIKRERQEQIDLLRIPFDDPATFALLGRGETVGLFQLEGRGMTGYLRELKPTGLDDITAMIALYRPGPMANIPSYVERKHGREPVTYPHPLLAEILDDTYGVLTFQDQVLQVLRHLAGYSLGQADIVRKAMGKKIRELMDKERAGFVEGCRATRGLSEAEAESIWNLLAPFAGYGFNRAHAACYAQIAYQTAYLKANYPVEFMTAILSTFRDTSDRVTSAVLECRRMGITVLPPDINTSGTDFLVERTDSGLAIRYALAAIKNVGQTAVEPIVSARAAGGAFASLDDFGRRVDAQALNRRVLESLVKTGALDRYGNRAQLLASIDTLMGASSAGRRARLEGQTSMFDLMGQEAEVVLTLPNIPEALEGERLEWERELLGSYFTRHPMAELMSEAAGLITCYCGEISEELSERTVTVAGVVSRLRSLNTRKGEIMGSAFLEDEHGSVELVIFSRTFTSTRDLLVDGARLLVSGRVDVRDERAQIVVGEVSLLSEALEAAAAAPDRRGSVVPEASFTARGNGRPADRGRNGRNGNGRAKGSARQVQEAPATERPRRRVQVTVPLTALEGEGKVLDDVLDLLDHHHGSDEVRLTVETAGGQVILERPGTGVDFGVEVVHAMRRFAEFGVLVESVP